ncbi:MAG TPA: metallophosphoesterase family protein [Anaerolineae bacterium]|nr:metallophosphoesterase family protein [Anaerolineae bacterium]HOQ98443.1 metallophosphoesterase family protein [Anaerolineae bacterium]HPL26726.1 metallophosphoesterase family protein [Anaerolineae bacterium]
MRYLILSDIHSNLAALEAVLADAGPVDAVWCLGDIVGYGPQPNECAARVQGLPNLVCVAGNHDWGALGKLDLATFNADARAAAEWTGRTLSAANRAWLDGLPERVRLEGFTLVHGSPRYPIWEYVLNPAIARENMAHFDTLTCLVGHTHVPAIFQEPTRREPRPPAIELSLGEPFRYRNARAIINPGGVGQPRDGDPRASFILLDPDAGTLEYRRVPYPIEETQALMREAGLPPRLAARLSYGI